MKHSQVLLSLLTASFATLVTSTATPRCVPHNRLVEDAVPFTKEFPYLHAIADGQPGSTVGNVTIPMPGDKAHEFQDPPPGAFRGVCPGLNIAANYGFLSRDGLPTFDELVAAQQNMYNFGYDISVVLAAASTGLTGDIYAGRMSLGGNASCAGVPGGGLSGYRFLEQDDSLTKTDYAVSKTHDNFSFNATLWQLMYDTAVKYSSNKENPIFGVDALAKFKSMRYEMSKAENPEFSFNAVTVLYYAAATVMYELFQGQGQPDLAAISSAYGAHRNRDGTWSYVTERLPKGWRNRSTVYDLRGMLTEVHRLYTMYYKEVGHNEGAGNFIADAANLQFPPNGTVTDLLCWIYDSFTGRGRDTPTTLPLDRMRYITNRINPHFAHEGCQVMTF